MKYLIILFFSFFFLSCSTEWDPYANKKFQTFSNQDFKTTINLKARKPDLFIDPLIRPGALAVIEDYLIILDKKGEHPVHSYNLKTQAYKGLLTFGEGPGEMVTPDWLSSSNDSSVLIFDFAQRKILNYHIDSLVKERSPNIERRIKEQNLISSPTIVGNEIYYLLEGSGKNRLYSINLKTGEEEGFGDLLKKKTLNTTELVHAQACGAKMTYLNEKFYIAYRLTPFVEIFDCKHKTWKGLKGPEDFTPVYAEANMKGISVLAHRRGKTLYAFKNIAATKEFIYLLYLGAEASKELANKHIVSARDIYVLNRNEKVIKHYKLDKGLTYFTVYKDSIIYGINYDFAPELVEYQLK